MFAVNFQVLDCRHLIQGIRAIGNPCQFNLLILVSQESQAAVSIAFHEGDDQAKTVGKTLMGKEWTILIYLNYLDGFTMFNKNWDFITTINQQKWECHHQKISGKPLENLGEGQFHWWKIKIFHCGRSSASWVVSQAIRCECCKQVVFIIFTIRICI